MLRLRQGDDRAHVARRERAPPVAPSRRAGDRRDVAGLDRRAALEEDVFYPYVRDTSDRLELIEEAFIEHDSTRELMDELRREDSGSPRFHALMKVLGEYVSLHVREEEERIFPLVEKMGIDLEALGEELAEHRGDGESRAHGRRAGARESQRSRGRARGHGDGDAGNRHGAGHDGADRRAGHASADTTRDDERYLEAHGDELSRSARHARWIHGVDEHADHDGQTLATRNPDVIRQWADERGGRPATSPGGDAERPRVLRIDFPDYDKNLQPVSWDAWLGVFRERDLVFLYQEKMKAGNQSNFFRLDSPERGDG